MMTLERLLRKSSEKLSLSSKKKEQRSWIGKPGSLNALCFSVLLVYEGTVVFLCFADWATASGRILERTESFDTIMECAFNVSLSQVFAMMKNLHSSKECVLERTVNDRQSLGYSNFVVIPVTAYA
jgi:hypothetical protein